jgi:hypothetical protein
MWRQAQVVAPKIFSVLLGRALTSANGVQQKLRDVNDLHRVWRLAVRLLRCDAI